MTSRTWHVHLSLATASDVPRPDHATRVAHAALTPDGTTRLTGTGRVAPQEPDPGAW